MSPSKSSPETWHRLLAPLPADALPSRSAVASPEVLSKPEGAAIAGWEQLLVELSAGTAGMRVLLVVLDAAGQPISASDMVMYSSETVQDGEAVTEYRHESLGGRLEADGSFRGTRWLLLNVQAADGREISKEATPSEPDAAEVSALKALVAEILRRAG